MDFLLAILSAGIGAGLMAIVRDLIQRKWKKADQREEEEEKKEEATITELRDEMRNLTKVVSSVVTAQRATMVERIRYLGLCYIGQGKISMEDKIQLKKMNDAYRQLPDANGDTKPIMSEVEKLPVYKSE